MGVVRACVSASVRDCACGVWRVPDFTCAVPSLVYLSKFVLSLYHVQHCNYAAKYPVLLTTCSFCCDIVGVTCFVARAHAFQLMFLRGSAVRQLLLPGGTSVDVQPRAATDV
jgi:hypothetical protein